MPKKKKETGMQDTNFEMQSAVSRKTVIMREAIKLFLSQGYCNTSLQQIAEKSGASTSLIIYYFGTKKAIAAAYLGNKMEALQALVTNFVNIRSNPELFCSSFVYLYQSVMSSPKLYKFYHESIDEGIYRDFFFTDENELNACDLILVKRQAQIPLKLHAFYSHYLMPSIELAAWLSAKGEIPGEEMFDIPFRALMGMLSVSKEETDNYCSQTKKLVAQIISDHPEIMEP